MLANNSVRADCLSFLGGGAQSTFVNARGRRGWSMANRLAFGPYVSYPPGLYETAVSRPVSVGGIGARLIAEAFTSADLDATAELDGLSAGEASGSGALTGLRDSPGVSYGQATVTGAILARGTIAGTVKIGSITQDDVTGAVLEAPVEGDLTVRQALRVLLAVAAGKSTVTDLGGGAATVTFRDQSDTTDRITATMAGSERTDVVLDTA